MQQGFASGELSPTFAVDGEDAPGFCEAMITFKYVLTMIWQYGHCRSLIYQPDSALADVKVWVRARELFAQKG